MPASSRLQPRLPKLTLRLLDNAGLCEPAGGPTEAGAVWLWLGCAGVGALGGLVLGNWIWGLAGAVLGAAAPVIVVLLRQGERDRRLALALPEFLESMARSLRSGSSLSVAAVEASQDNPGLPWPLTDELARVRAELLAGMPFRESIAAWQQRRPLPPVTLTTAALLLSAGVGGEKARCVDAVAATLREQNAIGQELAASSAQARLSAMVIAALPLAFLFMTSAAGSASGNLLWSSRFGLLCLGAGVCLNALGGWWMRRILRGAPV